MASTLPPFVFSPGQLEQLKTQITSFKALSAELEKVAKAVLVAGAQGPPATAGVATATPGGAVAAPKGSNRPTPRGGGGSSGSTAHAQTEASRRGSSSSSRGSSPYHGKQSGSFAAAAQKQAPQFPGPPLLAPVTLQKSVPRPPVPNRSDGHRYRRVQSGLFFPGIHQSEYPAPFPFSATDLGASCKLMSDAPVLDAAAIVTDKANCLDLGARVSAGEVLSLDSLSVATRAAYLQHSMRWALSAAGKKLQAEKTRENPRAQLAERRHYRRTKRQTRKEIRAYEKELMRLATHREQQKTKQYKVYMTAVLEHREAFTKFHRMKRSDAAKAARAVRSHLELLAIKAEKEEDKAERRRIQALKANDMEAYTKLVEETKNERLKYLLEQTDRYIDEISVKIRMQKISRGDGDDEVERDGSKPNYFLSAHCKSEDVRQPRMLIGGELKEYQLEGLKWLVSLYNNNLNGILADEMGLGKTIQTIALITYVMEAKNNPGPFLVVVPLSTLSNWVNEFAKWAPDVITVVYRGLPPVRKEIQRQQMDSGQYNLLLTTYELIMQDKAVLKRTPWEYIIVDEGHRMKNAQSKFAMTLGKEYTSRNRVLLTGTPLQNNLPELWALLNFLLPSVFSSVDTFDQWFNAPFASFQAGSSSGGGGDVGEEADGVPDITAEERMLIINRLHELLRPFMLRRIKASVMGQLPQKVEKVLRCELAGWQRQLYKQIQEDGAASIQPDGAGGSRGLNNVFMQLRKICNHPYLFSEDSWPVDNDLVRASGKFELLDRMLPKLKAAGHRVLMFSQMTQAMDIMEDFFCLRGMRYLRLDGSTSAEDREQRMSQFNAPDSPYFIFILSTRAGGLGLNLATADTVIIFDSDWNPMMDAQAQDRAHRIGQKNEVRVFRLITNSPIEERIISRANEKLNMTGLVVEAGKFNKDSKASERKAMMETLLRRMDDVEEEGESGVPDDEAINAMMAHSAEELELYAKMDAERLQLETEWARERGLKEWVRLLPPDGRPHWWGINAAAAAARRDPPPPPSRRALAMAASAAAEAAAAESAQTAQESRYDYADKYALEEPSGSARKGKRAASTGTTGATTPGQGKRPVATGAAASAIPDLHFLPPAPPVPKRIKITYQAAEAVENSRKQAMISSASASTAKPALNHSRLPHEAFPRMEQIMMELKSLQTEEGRVISELFLVKPSRKVYPDYYVVIKKPIDIVTICKKVRKRACPHCLPVSPTHLISGRSITRRTESWTLLRMTAGDCSTMPCSTMQSTPWFGRMQ
jgi:ATP-dependent helicase STH1/SNF2